MENLLVIAKYLAGSDRKIYHENGTVEWDQEGCTLTLNSELSLKIEANIWNNAIFTYLQVDAKFPLSLLKKQIDNVYFRAENKRKEQRQNELSQKTSNGKIYITTEHRLHAL